MAAANPRSERIIAFVARGSDVVAGFVMRTLSGLSVTVGDASYQLSEDVLVRKMGATLVLEALKQYPLTRIHVQ